MKSKRIKRKVFFQESGAAGLNMGMTTAVVGCHYGVNKLTLSFMKTHEENIKGSVKASAPLSVKLCVTHCAPFLELTEGA